MPSASMSIKTAWDLLQAAHRREARRKVNYEGADWYQITPEEQKVFGIDLLTMRGSFQPIASMKKSLA